MPACARSKPGRATDRRAIATAWLILVGRNAALDGVRRRGKQAPLPPEEALSDLDDAEAALAERLDGSHYRDDVLRLLFMCCHPGLPVTQQIALALRIVSGLSVKQIARAFLVERGGDGAAHHARQGADREGRHSLRDAGRGRARRASRHGRGDDLPRLQRGLFGRRRLGARRALRRGDPAGAAAAAPVPGRAGDHGPDGADAAAAGARGRPFRRRRRDHPPRGPGSRALGRQADRRGTCPDRQGDASPPARAVSDPGRDRRACMPAPLTRAKPIGPESTRFTPRSSACSPRRW